MTRQPGVVQTVCGPIRPAELGPTLMHEHLLCDVTPPGLGGTGHNDVVINLENVWEVHYFWGTHHPGTTRITDREAAVREMERLKRDGGQSLVELTNHGLKRDPVGLRDISERTGIHVIMGSGHYLDDFLTPEMRARDIDGIARDIVSDIVAGVDSTGVRAGIIGEMGCSWPWTEAERRAMRGAVAAQAETGATITVHPGRHPDSPFAIVRFIGEAGGDVSRTIMGHVDRTITDVSTLLKLADTGCVIEFDLFGIETTLFPYSDAFLPNDGMRLDLIRALIEAGHRDRIVLSQDICTRVRQTAFGGHGYGHIFRNVVPLMYRKGFSRFDIDALLVRNPARLLTLS